MSAPDLSQKVLGYRQWDVVDEQLVSSGWGRVFWYPGVNEGRCLKYERKPHRLGERPSVDYFAAEHVAPHPGCHCGLYAHHDPSPKRWLSGPVNSEIKTVGAILGWGQMEVHVKGWRSQYAEVALLAYDELKGYHHVELIKKQAAYYGCETVRLEEFVEASKKLGRGIPQDLYPPPDPPPPTADKPAEFMASMMAALPPSIVLPDPLEQIPKRQRNRILRKLGSS